MRKILTTIVTILISASLWAVQAYRGWQTKTQPDGSEITVRQIGDEFFHYWETEDGKIALEQANGTFVRTNEVKPSDEQINAKRAASPMYKHPRKAIGKLNLAPRGLLILVQFSDVTFAANNTQAAFNDMLNTPGYNYNGATGCAAEYFKAQSNNQYTPAFDVVGPVTLSHTCAYYGEQGTINGRQENDMYIADFVTDAVDAADDLGCDFSQYDADNDGYVDFVYFIYAGKGQAAGGETWTIWPHNWTLASALYYGQTHGTSGYSYSPYVVPKPDGKKINNYACSAELRSGGDRSGIGTFCHEFGHVMGLPDYYVTDGNATNNKKNYTPGAWSIMDYGSYNNNEMTPPNYSVYDKLFFGWNTPELLSKDAKRDITLTTDYSSNYQITGTTTSATAKTEATVWYVENRQKTGWDAYLPGHGMLIWEVTYNNTDWENNAPNNENIGYTIVTANNTTRPYKPCQYTTTASSTTGTTFPGKNNVTSFTPATGCEITNIAENAGVITFKYNGGEVNYWTYEISTTHCTASPASGQVDKNAALNLTITTDQGYTLDNADCWAVEMGDDILVYGTGFTYNASNGAFNIPVVTGDVYIIVEAQEVPQPITWMANGTEHAVTNTSGGKLVLPDTDPTPCEGKVFMGWTAIANYSSETTAPTFVKAGDDATETTYYAVYATENEGGEPTTIVERMKTTSPYVSLTGWTTNASDTYTSTGNYGASSPSLKLTTTGHYVQSALTDAAITAVSYWYKSQSATDSSVDFYVSTDGSSFSKLSEETVTLSSSSSGTKSISLDVNDGYKAIKLVYNKENGNLALDDISISYGGTTYSDYTTSCIPPTKYTITINETTNGSVATDPASEAAAGKTVTITATPAEHYHLATLTVKDAENADVALSGTGNTRTFTMPEKAVTISATFEEDTKYTVRFINAGEEVSSASYYLGQTAETPADPTPECEAYTFVGWWTAELAADNTTAQTWITDFTVTGAQDYYAIYSKTVSSGPSSSTVTFTPGTDTGATSVTKDNVTCSMTTMNNSSYYQIYANASGTFSCNTLNITKIEFTCTASGTSKYGPGNASANVGNYSYSGTKGTWTGNAASITLSTTAQIRMNSLSITIGGSSSTTYYSSAVSCTSTDCEQVKTVEKAQKVLYNGQIMIIRGKDKYTIFGQKIQ